MKFFRKTAAFILCIILFSNLFSCGTQEGAPPVFDYIYNTSESHKAIGEYLQAAFSVAGIKVNLSNQEWNTFLNTRKNGEYTIARNGWVADYSDPISFLDMWTSYSGNNDVGFGTGAHAELKMYDLDLTEYGYGISIKNGRWCDTYDLLISTIKSCDDADIRFALMHIAEDMLMDSGCIMPIYYNTDVYMASKELENYFVTPLGYKFFTEASYLGGNAISVCLSSEPDTLDPALNASLDGATMLSHLFSGLAKWSVVDGKISIAADYANELTEGIRNDDGSISYIYTIKDGAKWSDGVELTAYDFEFAWKRAASKELGADYGYTLDVIKRDENGELLVTAMDKKTLSVTLAGQCSYWNELLAFPVLYPLREDVVADESWATEAETFISCGPYYMSNWRHDSKIVLTKNTNHYSAENTKIEQISFFLSDDTNNMLANFQNGALQFIDDIPSNEAARLKKEFPDEFFTSGLIGTYYISWNINAQILPKDSELKNEEAERASADIRKAVSLLIDRNYICEYIVKGGQIPASSFVAMGFKEPDGSEFYQNAGDSEEYYGYFDTRREAFSENTKEALAILQAYYKLDIYN